MSTDKRIDKICISGIAITLVITIVFMSMGMFTTEAAAKSMRYESTLFDTSYVHKIDIVMNDWDTFIKNCENEEYSACTLVVDGKKQGNVAIRAKGNTSLSSVRSMGSQRYSFKLEFDHFEKGKTLDGLDKLCLNNLIQDNTMMKDYIAYRLMDDFSVDSPLCAFAYVTVNGEDWGLYLAVEGVEDSFLSRNYGSETGDLYKPDSMSFGGGRGNGKDFNMDDFDFGDSDSDAGTFNPGNFDMGNFDFGNIDFGDFNPEDFDWEGFGNGNFNWGNFNPEDFDWDSFGGGNFDWGNFGFGASDSDNSEEKQTSESSDDSEKKSRSNFGAFSGKDNSDWKNSDSKGNGGFGGFGGFGGMGSDDVKLKYIDDDASSYSNIFNNAKTTVTAADKTRLINSLKLLSSYSELDSVLDMDEVLRYFVVHNFVCNGDSYTGSMIHNYYLHEKDGKLGMIPWDYNLAFGTFMGGSASSSVNADIDNPVSGGMSDRPMVGWIFSDEKYTEEYHKLFREFMNKWFSDGELEKMISETADMIKPYVEKDPTKFCTLEDFEKGVSTMINFVNLRGEAVGRQLNGDNSTVDAASVNTSDMGSMGGGFGGGKGMNRPGSKSDTSKKQNDNEEKDSIIDNKLNYSEKASFEGMSNDVSDLSTKSGSIQKLGAMRPPEGFQMPEGMEFPGGMQPPEGFQMPEGMEMPEGMQAPEGFQMPEGMGRPGTIGSQDSAGAEDDNDKQEKEAADKAKSDTTEQKDRKPNSGNSGDEKSSGNRSAFAGMSFNSSGSRSNVGNWVMVGVSALVLILGLVVAIKKKY